MDKNLEGKRKYFKDCVYLKYENLKSTESEGNELENIKTKNKIKLNTLQKVAAHKTELKMLVKMKTAGIPKDRKSVV